MSQCKHEIIRWRQYRYDGIAHCSLKKVDLIRPFIHQEPGKAILGPSPCENCKEREE